MRDRAAWAALVHSSIFNKMQITPNFPENLSRKKSLFIQGVMKPIEIYMELSFLPLFSF